VFLLRQLLLGKELQYVLALITLQLDHLQLNKDKDMRAHKILNEQDKHACVASTPYLAELWVIHHSTVAAVFFLQSLQDLLVIV